MAARVLVVDDDAALAEMLGIVLGGEGFDVEICAEGHLALEACRASRPDLVLLDLMLPGMDGISVCRALRADSDVPIIMLTARGDTADVVSGLEVGADDYVVKPFKPKELVARIRARLRGQGSGASALREARELLIGDLVVDIAGHCVYRGDETIDLTPLEFDLLVALAQRPGEVCSRAELLSDVWGYTHTSDTRLVNVHVQRLRSKVERDPENPQVVLTVRGIGYKPGPVDRAHAEAAESPDRDGVGVRPKHVSGAEAT